MEKVNKWMCFLLILVGFNSHSCQDFNLDDNEKGPQYITQGDKPPNIIFIMADDLGWNDVGFHGVMDIPTPNLDALAADGVQLNNYYVSPTCTPSRAAAMTGYYPIHTGLQHIVIQRAGPYGLPLNFTIMPQWLNKLGYTSKLVGKWHLGYHQTRYTPTRRGFDSHFGFWGGNSDFFAHTGTEIYNRSSFSNIPREVQGDRFVYSGYDFRRNDDLVPELQGNYITDLYTNEALDIIEKHNKEKPLFMFLSHHAPHRGNLLLPVRSPPEYADRFWYIRNSTRRNFAGVIAALDEGIGRVVHALYAENMMDNTIIVFTTDNGADIAYYGNTGGSNWPLKGSKGSLWEGGVRGVGFVWSPLIRRPRRISQHLMHMCDWLPTLYSAAGGNPKDLGTIDGVDMWEALSLDLPESPRKELLINYDSLDETSALRMYDYKIVNGPASNQPFDRWWGPTGRDVPAPPNTYSLDFVSPVLQRFRSERREAVSIRPHRLLVPCGERPRNKNEECDLSQGPCLFNIREDPCEYRNIANEFPDIVEVMQARIRDFIRTSLPPSFPPNDFNSNPLLHGGVWVSWRD